MVKLWWVRLLDLEEHPHGGHLMERGFHLSELDEGDSKTPDVDSVVVRLVPKRFAGNNLRSHPVWRPYEGVSFLVVLLVLCRHAEVGEFHLTRCCKKHIACFQVPGIDTREDDSFWSERDFLHL